MSSEKGVNESGLLYILGRIKANFALKSHSHSEYAGTSHTHAAADTTSGTFDAARIPNLSASKINDGTFAAARIPTMTGATSSAAGTKGAAPAPAAGDQAKYLQGDGAWDTPAARHGTGTNAVVEGDSTTASAYAAHAEGYQTTASANGAHAEGVGSTASEQGAHAEGGSTASGVSSHSEGMGAAEGDYSHAEGSGYASGEKSHAEGASEASGETAHAEGYGVASGYAAHAEGLNTVATHLAQHVFGAYNAADPSSATGENRGTYVEIVGKGTSDSARSNARTLDWSGNEVLAGSLTTGGSITVPSGSQYNGSGAGLTNIPASAITGLTITEVYKYKGSVAAEANLPANPSAGDVYNIVAASTYGSAGINVAWTGSAWDALGGSFDHGWMSNTEIDAVFTTAGLTAT